jgi:hypothetical protein
MLPWLIWTPDIGQPSTPVDILVLPGSSAGTPYCLEPETIYF